jgi:hypothetical protein
MDILKQEEFCKALFTLISIWFYEFIETIAEIVGTKKRPVHVAAVTSLALDARA